MARNNILQTKFNGDLEAYSQYMSSLGKKGGKAKVATKGNGYITVHGKKKNEA
jgi:hypothetical protein